MTSVSSVSSSAMVAAGPMGWSPLCEPSTAIGVAVISEVGVFLPWLAKATTEPTRNTTTPIEIKIIRNLGVLPLLDADCSDEIGTILPCRSGCWPVA